MVQLSDLEIGEKYEVVIVQSDTEYTALVTVETPLDSITEKAMVQVEDSEYPNGNWDGKTFQFHKDGTVTASRDPFGPIGQLKLGEINKAD